jgi:hypothetical protein
MSICVVGCATFTHSPIPIYHLDQIPLTLCVDTKVQEFGITRTLNDGTEEYMSYCNPNIKRFLAVDGEDIKKVHP